MILLYIILLCVVLFCIVVGLNRGLFLETVSFCSLFASLAVAFTFFSLQAKYVNDFLSAYFKYEHTIMEAISFVTLFIVAYLIFLAVSKVLLSGVRMKFAVLVDTIAGAFIGTMRGLIITSLIVVVLAMFPAKEGTVIAGEDLTKLRNIYVVAPRFYEFLSDKLTSDSKFDTDTFLKAYGKILVEEELVEEE